MTEEIKTNPAEFNSWITPGPVGTGMISGALSVGAAIATEFPGDKDLAAAVREANTTLNVGIRTSVEMLRAANDALSVAVARARAAGLSVAPKLAHLDFDHSMKLLEDRSAILVISRTTNI